MLSGTSRVSDNEEEVQVTTDRCQRTVRGFMPVLSLCNQVDLWRYGRSAALAVF
jgi:hypothetical protein